MIHFLIILFSSHNFILEHLLGLNGNIVSLFLIIFFIVYQFSKNPNSFSELMLCYLVLICILQILYMIRVQQLQSGFIEASVLYFIIPIYIFYFHRAIRFNPEQGLFVLSCISYMSLISFIGSIVFILVNSGYINFSADIFKLEYTISNATLQIRNTSWYGNSLFVCVISLFESIASAMMFLKTRKLKYLIFMMLSVCTVMLSLSRRGMIPVLFVIFALVTFLPKNWKYLSASALVCVISLISLFFPETMFGIFSRIISSFDLVDANNGNLARLKFMVNGMALAITEFGGVGIGNMTSIGKSVEDLLYNPEKIVGFRTVAESTYVVLFAELGMVSGIVVTLLIWKFIKNMSKESRYLFAVPLGLEMIMGLSLYTFPGAIMAGLILVNCLRGSNNENNR